MSMSSISSMPMSTEANQEVCAIIAANLRILIREMGITQRRLAEQIGVAPATMNDYCSGKRAPQATFFVELRKLYGIDINEFLTSTIHVTSASRQTTSDSLTESLRKVYGKYCGIYYVYYLDTSRFRARIPCRPPCPSPARNPLHPEALLGRRPPLQLRGCWGSRSRGSGLASCREFRTSDAPVNVLEKIDSSYSRMAYYGNFEIGQEHAFLQSQTHRHGPRPGHPAQGRFQQRQISGRYRLH